jgi:hypothetical protein
VEAHGGNIFVRSVPDVGSTFTVMLKCFEKSQENCDNNISALSELNEEKGEGVGTTTQLAPDPFSSNPNPLSVSSKPLHLDSCLIVDDSALNRKLLEKHLRPYFKIIRTAENGFEAIEEVKKMMEDNQMFDLICLDSIMPVSLFRPSTCLLSLM